MSRSQQKILDGLAWLETVGIPDAPWNVVAWIGDQSPKSSGYEKNISTLNTAGLIEGGRKRPIQLVAAGRALARTPDLPATNEELRRMIYAKISGPQVRMLDALVRAGRVLSWDELAEESIQSPTSSGFEKNVSTLRTLNLVAGTRATGFEATSLLWLGESSAA